MRINAHGHVASATLLLAFLAAVPANVQAQLEEIIVTASRRETSLQQTPISVQAFNAEDIELAGLDGGRDLGIMVPNVVMNSGGVGERNAIIVARGVPGVGVYVDGVWQGNTGFLQTNFVEMERVEVLRGPQGTLFGRNTNGGAIQMITREPADEFGARVNMEVGEFERRDVTLAADLPLSDTVKTKWMAASLQNDGFLQSVAVPRAYGDQDDELFRGDVLWEPTDTFSLRFTANTEDKKSNDARIVRFTNDALEQPHARYIAYNVLINNPDFVDRPGFQTMDFGLPINRFTPETHQTNFPGGQLGKWETRSDTVNPGTIVDTEYYTLTADWDITPNLALELIASSVEQDTKQITDFDSSELTITTDDRRDFNERDTLELHLTGTNLNGRLNWLAGLYQLEQTFKNRFYRWGLWEFTIPAAGGPNDPWNGTPFNNGQLDFERINYVRSWGQMFDDPRCLDADDGNDPISCVSDFFPISFITNDALSVDEDEDTAFFGEVTIGVTDRLDVTLGVRITSDDGRSIDMEPTDGFRTLEPEGEPAGCIYCGVVTSVEEDPDLGNITTNKFALQHQFTDDLMAYFTWSEGFTSGGVTISNNFPEPIVLDPEIVTNREIGLRSDWLDGRLRFNASIFDMDWDGLRVPILPDDPNNPGQQLPFPVNTSEGLAAVEGAEFELVYRPADRWLLRANLGLLDTEYLDVGDPPASGNGIQPGQPFQYAPETSYSLSAQYDMPLANGGRLMFRGDYGWMDEYQRDPANQRQPHNPDGSIKFEPSYGILNARVAYEPADAQWNLAVFGTNLTDEWYVNGGFDARNVWGYDFSTIGRPREVGVSLRFFF